MPAPHTIAVHLGDRSYTVTVGSGVLGMLGEVARRACPSARRACVIFDTGVPMMHVDAALGALEGADFGDNGGVVRLGFEPSERAKTLTSAECLLREIALARHERGDPIVVIGGGITCDVAGFVAATYRRGVPVIQCPTTLLAMVDASVGGKTGVNLEVGGAGERSLRKNMVGAFHQPAAVLADVDVLSTLDEREVRCGLAECVKHAMLSGGFGQGDLFELTLEYVRAARGLGDVAELVARNVSVKAGVVAADERESSGGVREALNLGHTFGHALETLPGLGLAAGDSSGLQHGEAVALGLRAAMGVSKRLGLVDRAYVKAVDGVLAAAGLPVRVWGMPDSSAVLERMRDDKKVRGGVLRLVLPRLGYRVEVAEVSDVGVVTAALDDLRGE